MDDIWKFTLEEMEVRDDTFKEQSDRCNVVSMNAENNPIDMPQKKPEKKDKRKRSGRMSGAK